MWLGSASETHTSEGVLPCSLSAFSFSSQDSSTVGLHLHLCAHLTKSHLPNGEEAHGGWNGCQACRLPTPSIWHCACCYILQIPKQLEIVFITDTGICACWFGAWDGGRWECIPRNTLKLSSKFITKRKKQLHCPLPKKNAVNASKSQILTELSFLRPFFPLYGNRLERTARAEHRGSGTVH